MKPSPANLWQRLPGPASWEWWSRPGGAPEPVASEEGPRGQAPAVYGFAARDCESVPVWVSSAEPEIIAQFLAVEMERLGVRLPAGSGRHLGWHTVTSDGPRRLIQAIVVPEALDPDAAKSGATNWTAFRPSPLFFKPPARAITLWKENGHWIAGFENHEQWVHFQPLGPSELGEDLLRDVECLHLELDGRRIIGPVDSLVIWTDGEPVWAAFRDLTHEILGLPVRVAPKPPPNPALADDDAWDFEPATVALERERRETAGRWFRVASIAAVLYILLIGAGVVSLTLQRKKTPLSAANSPSWSPPPGSSAWPATAGMPSSPPSPSIAIPSSFFTGWPSFSPREACA